MYWTGQRIAAALATYRARKAQEAAIKAEAQAKLAADAAKRLQEAAAVKQAGMAEVYGREAERKRVAELSARGGVPLPTNNLEFSVVVDEEGSRDAQLRGEANWIRYRSLDGARSNLTTAQLPKIDAEATTVARLTNPNAPAVMYWPE